MVLFKSKYASKSIQKSRQNATSSGKLSNDDRTFIRSISIQMKSRLFLKVGSRFKSKAPLLLQWLYLRSSGHEVFIPQEAIANDLNVSVRTIKRWVKELVDNGYIAIKWFRNEDGLNSTSGMRLAQKAWSELIRLHAGWNKYIKNKVREYRDAFKRTISGGDIMSPSKEIRSLDTENLGDFIVPFPKYIPDKAVEHNICIEIPF